MKKIILSLIVFGNILSGFSQGKNEVANKSNKQRIGIDLGLGTNSFSSQNGKYTKVAVDLGLIYELEERLLFGLDLSISPKEKYEDTGVDGSRSTHVKWDGEAICIEAYVGHRLFNYVSFFAGLGTCISTEYEVMRGYKNLTSYKRGNKIYLSPLIGVKSEFPKDIMNGWYLKYDMAFGGYKKYSIGVGLEF